MNIAKFIMVALHSNAVCQLLIWSYKTRVREKLRKRYRIWDIPTLKLLWRYFIPKGDTSTSISENYPNIFNLLCIATAPRKR